MKRTIISITIIILSLNCFSQTQKADTSNYHLVGKLDDFKLVYAAIMQPDDVTANQKKAIAKWLETIKVMPVLKPDTSAVKNPKR